MNCVFCDIIAGKVEASIIYRDECVCAFMDIQPVNPGHILVVPTAHAIGLSDISAEDAASVFLTAQRIACALKSSGLPCEGVNLFLADGAAAMQEIFHFHLHVFPRYSGDGFGLTFSDRYYQKPTRAEIDASADAVRAALTPTNR
jgi:histidine triad (HIT) family protein